ncbi:MAG: ketoacyl-ACP synthase III [Chitinophagaceae bacterium]|nr:ketoacyl-ACP synthase III [Chitinophagaceae bacterium]MCA6511679.1 ketoacyl-ACP synthase III [Chitinophagaceae bacterium]
MNLKFKNKIITGLLTILPSREVLFEDEMMNYTSPIAKSLKLKSAMGFNKKRIVADGITSSDLCIAGLKYLFDNELLRKDDIDALILVTQSPDYIMPPTSNVIQGHFKLKHDMICLDINQGCAGYIVGLIQAFMLLDQGAINKVVLLNADVLSPKVSKKDRNSNPLIGDGASITIIEKSTNDENIFVSIKMNGEGAFALQIPAGGSRLPSSPETAILEEDMNGNIRSKNHLVMKGDEVFNFVQTDVPILIQELYDFSKIKQDEIDFFMFHQPNKFMLNKLADRLGVERDKMPSNIVENFGNSSGVTIPVAITFNLGDKLCSNKYRLCLSGFGVGLTWAAMIIDMKNLSFCKIINN